MEGCGNKFMKYFIVAINVVFLIIGLALAAIAGYAAFDTNSTIHKFIIGFHISNMVAGLYIMMAVGIFLVLISFLGCIGASTENRCMLGTYFGIILIIFIIQLAAVILCFVKYKDIKKELKLTLLSSATSEAATALRQSLDIVQVEFHCCGVDSSKDWAQRGIPSSCYQPVKTNITPKGDEEGLKENVQDENFDGGDGSNVQSVAGKATAKPVVATTSSTTTKKAATTKTTTTTKKAVVAATTKKAVVAATTKIVAASTKHVQPVKTTLHQVSSPKGKLYTTGCLNKLKPAFYAAGIIGILVLFLEITVMVFACLLYSAIKSGYSSIA